MAVLVVWAGFHLLSQTFQQHRSLLSGTENKSAMPVVEDFKINYGAFVCAVLIVNPLLWVGIYRFVPEDRHGPFRLVCVTVAWFASQLPWLFTAFRMSAGPGRRFFGVSFCLLLVWAIGGIASTPNQIHGCFAAIAGLLGGLVMLWAARMRKRGPTDALPEPLMRSFSDGLTFDAKAFALTLFFEIAALALLGRWLFAEDRHGFLCEAIINIFFPLAFLALLVWRRQAPAASLLLFIAAVFFFDMLPVLFYLDIAFGRIEQPNLHSFHVIMIACAMGWVAGFGLVKFGRIRRRQ